jgi:serine/threonine protein kinase
MVVKSPKTHSAVERETTILKKMKHPLVIKYIPNKMNLTSALTYEFIPNGSLANHLPQFQNSDLCLPRGPNRIARVMIEIVLAMCYVHSQSIIHHDLTPENILLDWKWNIRIADFGGSTSPDKSWISSISDDSAQVWPSGNSYYLAPECYDHIITPENDRFSFGLILYEHIIGKPAIPKTMDPHKVGKMVVMEDWKPDITHFVLPQTKELILDFLLKNYRYRLLFSDIFDRIESMKFKLMPGVNSSILVKLVKEIQAWEAANLIH